MVPYGTQIVAVAAGGSVVAAEVLPASLMPTISLVPTVMASSGGNLSTGQVYVASAVATLAGSSTPIAGVPLAFATTTTGVTFAPATVMTDSTGSATSLVTVAYDSPVAIAISGPGVVVSAILPAGGTQPPAATLTAPAFAPTTTVSPTGQVFAVSTRAMTTGASPTPVQGLSVTFGTTYATTTSGYPLFSPATVLTDPNGNASSYVIVPYDNQLVAEVSGGGSVATSASPVPAITLSAPTFADTGTKVAAGEVYAVSSTVLISDGVPATPIPGVGVTFGGSTFSPATPLTNSSGTATTYATLDAGVEVLAIASALGASATSVVRDFCPKEVHAVLASRTVTRALIAIQLVAVLVALEGCRKRHASASHGTAAGDAGPAASPFPLAPGAAAVNKDRLTHANNLRKEVRARGLDAKPGRNGAPKGVKAMPPRSASFEALSNEDVLSTLEAQQKSIYGKDTRQESLTASNPRLRALSGSVAALFDVSTMAGPDATGNMTLPGDSLMDKEGVCSDVTFAHQPAGAYCTAFPRRGRCHGVGRTLC